MNSLGDFDIDSPDLQQTLFGKIDSFVLYRQRKNREETLKVKLYQSEQRCAQLEKKEAKSFQRELFREVVKLVEGATEGVLSHQDFLSALAGVVEQLGFVREYAFFELNHSGEKLVSRPYPGRKNRELPSLSLGGGPWWRDGERYRGLRSEPCPASGPRLF